MRPDLIHQRAAAGVPAWRADDRPGGLRAPGLRSPALGALSMRTRTGLGDYLAGRRRGVGGALLFAGPALLAATAYMDPGNFAVNIYAGAGYGYGLLWVVLLANVTAMLFQALSAKLGIVTGRNLAELCRERLPRPLVWVMWAISELAAMATDLAEFLGGAIGFALLFDLPILAGMLLTAALSYAVLTIDSRGFRPTELIIGGFVVVIGLCYLVELAVAPIGWGMAARGLATPKLVDRDAVAVAVGIIGATVMPHALYLHSGLTQGRAPVANAGERRALLRFSNREVMVALAVAGAVNLAMVMLAAASLRGAGESIGIETAYRLLGPLLGAAAAVPFLISLIASGIASSVVGTMAGQIVMQGFLGWNVPVAVRRLVTMLPAFAVIGFGLDPTAALVLSQILLSLALPVPMVALVLFTRRRDLMGPHANSRSTHAAAIAATAVVLSLNFVLLWQTLA